MQIAHSFIRISILVLGLLLAATSIIGQSPAPYAHLDFAAPMDIPLVLSGNFGEFRRNHFHSGLDIKTQGREGIALKSIYEGHVSRVRISPYGYGLALYIDHPNGYTSVYAHMQSFFPELAAWIEQEQYRLERYEVDLSPPPGLFPLAKGEFIGLSGNTGGSFGPHLHFEIRETATEFPMNGLLFGFDITDTRPPEAKAVWVFKTDEGHEFGSFEGKRHALSGNKAHVRIPAGKNFGFGVESIDRLNGASNRCGVYAVSLIQNKDTVHHHVIDKLDFETKRFINAHMVAWAYNRDKKSVHRCYRLPNNQLDIYHTPGNGTLTFDTPGTFELEFHLRDAHNNLTLVTAVVEVYKAQEAQEEKPAERLAYEQAHYLRHADANVHLPKGCMYDDTPVRIQKVGTHAEALGPQVRIGDSAIPLQETYTLEMHAGPLPAHLQSKALLVRVTGNRLRAAGGRYLFGWVSSQVKQFGTYQVMVDSVAPAIQSTILGTSNTLRFTITDDLSGIVFYQGKVDGEWCLFKYTSRNNRLEYTWRKGDLSPGEHEVEITVEDERGNLAVKRWTFTV